MERKVVRKGDRRNEIWKRRKENIELKEKKEKKDTRHNEEEKRHINERKDKHKDY